MEDPTLPQHSRNTAHYLRSRAQQWRIEALRTDRSALPCLALAEQFDAKADAIVQCNADFEALDRAINLLNALTLNGVSQDSDIDRAERIACLLARMDGLLAELDKLGLQRAAAHLSMARDAARAMASPTKN